jgi:outer membrane protein assembly factor BamB
MAARVLGGSIVLWLVTAAVAAPPEGKSVDWPTFRGPSSSGVAEGFPTVERFDVAKGENVLWKTKVPGLGHSSPVIWGDRIFVTSAISGKADPELRVGLYGNIEPVSDDTVHKFIVYCIDRKTGKILWDRTAWEGVPTVKRHTKASHANSTPATDGKRVVVNFGFAGLYCYDMDGNLKWKRDLGPLDSGYYEVPEAQWGFGSSPVIHDGRVIVQCDVQKDSFLAALSLDTGADVWRTPRTDVPSWSTPLVHRSAGRAQIVVNGWKHAGGYDLATGKELWKMHGRGDIPVPTPIAGHDLLFLAHAHAGAALFAVKPGATGDVTLSEGQSSSASVAWSAGNGAYMQTPLIYGAELYSCRDNGVLSVYDARTGTRHQQVRLGDGTSGFTASPVAADGKIYFTSEEGRVYVIQAGPEGKLLSSSEVGEVCMATPAIARGVLFFRGRDHLIAVGAKEAVAAGS